MRKRIRSGVDTKPGLSDIPVSACPGCGKRVFTRRDLVYTALEGSGACRSCGQSARLDMFSRWLLSCVIALSLSSLLLYCDLFFSGHLFVISCAFIFLAWGALAWLCSPIITLERARSEPRIDRKTGMLVLVVMIAAAGIFDTFMASHFETPDKLETVHSSTATQRE